jgi:hypothetical protein
MDEVKVLNGTVKVGDRVAVAVGDGKYGGGQRIGTVHAIGEVIRYGKPMAVLNVRVEQTSGTAWGKLPYLKRFEYPERVVKLASE